MLPGPDQVIACPKCKGLARYMTLRSGNTIGARLWTDGKQIAPMLPHPPAVVKCRHCAECYWLAEAEEIGTLERSHDKSQEVNPAWAEAQRVEEPSEMEYYQTLEKGLATNAAEERKLRILAWWRRNDALRNKPKAQPRGTSSAPGPWRENLEALVRLLSTEDDNDRLMKAEALRELGEFESAKQSLSPVNVPALASVVQQMRSLCDVRDTRVKELNLDD
jgi:hypothetical protein